MKRTQWLWLFAAIACGASADQVSWHHTALIDLYAVQPEHLDGEGEVIGFYQLSGSQQVTENLYWQASAFANTNGSVSAIAQDLQGASNIESQASVRVAEAYLGWEAGQWRVELGRRDENSVFAGADSATQFIQSS
ncbi:hypothetical protein CWI84_08230 [Idiomarina tyrosinivorans]|uniref:Uncharacterized protein n=1 Tax=Idiomarina tyrosinivorans TaxID=1445662 RepID=A0A432ZPW6_9GAMM|nr:hypothetical protein [Idiomarina tyrosinivorans]RUO79937.1 hypothetical protein CWI84_08230 [Idiomarina tyrosinivorans]